MLMPSRISVRAIRSASVVMASPLRRFRSLFCSMAARNPTWSLVATFPGGAEDRLARLFRRPIHVEANRWIRGSEVGGVGLNVALYHIGGGTPRFRPGHPPVRPNTNSSPAQHAGYLA